MNFKKHREQIIAVVRLKRAQTVDLRSGIVLFRSFPKRNQRDFYFQISFLLVSAQMPQKRVDRESNATKTASLGHIIGVYCHKNGARTDSCA